MVTRAPSPDGEECPPPRLETAPQRLVTHARLANRRRWWVAEMERSTVDWRGLRVVSIEYSGGGRQSSALTVPIDAVRARSARIEETVP